MADYGLCRIHRQVFWYTVVGCLPKRPGEPCPMSFRVVRQLKASTSRWHGTRTVRRFRVSFQTYRHMGGPRPAGNQRRHTEDRTGKTGEGHPVTCAGAALKRVDDATTRPAHSSVESGLWTASPRHHDARIFEKTHSLDA